MGFGHGPASGGGDSQIVLAARVLGDAIVKGPPLVDAAADAFLVAAEEEDLDGVASALKERVWGVKSGRFDAGRGRRLAEMGCDFVVFESMDTEASLLNEEDLGVVVTLDAGMGEEAVRAISDLPVDAVLLRPALRDLPLTVGAAADVQKVLGLLEKPLVVEAPSGAAGPDLELLRNMGVAGVVVDLDNRKQLKRLAGVKAGIQELPRPRSKRQERSALLPHQAGPVEGHDHWADDEDDF